MAEPSGAPLALPARRRHRATKEAPPWARFPPTRYQGSKRALLPQLAAALAPLDFDSFLDAFGGTAAVAYLAKTLGKEVTVNDALACNATTARALVENGGVRLAEGEAATLARPRDGQAYRRTIAENFAGIFYLDEENRWLDLTVQNVHALADPHARALALHALFQACLAKRPYNLFHRANLAMRTAEVPRSFGNKATWDRPFAAHFATALAAANGAVFDNGRRNRALCGDALEVPGDFNLVYLDPPYMSRRGVGVDYLDFYHFLEGLTAYGAWPDQIDRAYKHRPWRRRPSPWLDPRRIEQAFVALFDRHRASTLLVSYRDDGLPSPERLAELLARSKRRVRVVELAARAYTLAKKRSRELLFIGE